MPEVLSNLEVLQTVVALPIAVAGALAAALIRRRRPALLKVLLGFATCSALVGWLAFATAEAVPLSPTDIRAVLVAAKFATVFGLLLIFGAAGLAPARPGRQAA